MELLFIKINKQNFHSPSFKLIIYNSNCILNKDKKRMGNKASGRTVGEGMEI